MLWVGLAARYQEGSRTDTYVLLADPGGANSNSTSSSLLRKASISLMKSWWCGAGSKPLWRAHSVRLLRVDRRFRSSAAALAGSVCLSIHSSPARSYRSQFLIADRGWIHLCQGL